MGGRRMRMRQRKSKDHSGKRRKKKEERRTRLDFASRCFFALPDPHLSTTRPVYYRLLDTKSHFQGPTAAAVCSASRCNGV